MGNVSLCRVDKNNLKQKRPDNKKDNKNNKNNEKLTLSSNKTKTKNENFNEKENSEQSNNSKKDSQNKTIKIPCLKLKKTDNSNSKSKNNITPNSNENNSYDTSNNKNVEDKEKEKDQQIKNENRNNKNNYNIKYNSISYNKNKKIEDNSQIKKPGRSDSSLPNPNIKGDLIKENNDNTDKTNENNGDSSSSYNTDKINYDIPFPQITKIVTNASENIACLSFCSKDSIIVSIGDLEIIKLDKISRFNINDINSKYDYTRIRNYNTEEEHIINCENTTCFLTKSNYLLVNTVFEDNQSPISEQRIPYQNKILNNLEIKKGNIEMYNFCVPFDFDGDKFLFLDYQDRVIRRICIYFTLSKHEPYIHKINNDFGHISHMKLLDQDKILICRKYTICQIYKINETFTLLEEWEHIGEEIIAVNAYMSGTKLSEDDTINNFYNINDYFKKNKIFLHTINEGDDKIEMTRRNYQSEEKELKIKYKNYKKNNLIDSIRSSNSSFRQLDYNNKWNYKKKYKEENFFNNDNDDNNKNPNIEIEIYNKNKNKKNDNLFRKSEDENSKKFNNNFKLKTSEIATNKIPNIKNTDFNEDDKYTFITLDQNGNVNLRKNKKNKVLFNLYKINGIEQKYKDEEFFSVGFPYFIIMNSFFIAISTDHGIFVVAKCKK